MSKAPSLSFKENLRYDLSSGLVVFLVALPLCLGISLASGAPFFSGMIAGIIGGIVIGFISNSHVSVSGPAAGLAAIVLAGITSLGSFEVFLVAVVFAGILQIIMGLARLGAIAEYFPSGVIRGMLTAIGIIIIIKQIPHGLGYDDGLSFLNDSSVGSLGILVSALENIHPAAFLLCLLSLIILVVWDIPAIQKYRGAFPGGLVVVILGLVANEFLFKGNLTWEITSTHLVNVPVPKSFEEFLSFFTFPDFSAVSNYEVYVLAFTLAAVASIETLLCIEAADRLDTQRRVTSNNRELLAQGTGNILSGLVGGLPITSVIVRSSANVQAGAKTKLSAIIHGFLLLLSVVAIPELLNKIPLATLAAILLLVGYKLSHPSTFIRTYKKGPAQFIPFIITVVAILLTDLLIGVSIGFAVGLTIVLLRNLRNAYSFSEQEYQEGDEINIRVAEEVSFLNKAAIRALLEVMPHHSTVTIDCSNTVYMDSDVVELLKEFRDIKAPQRDIECIMIGFQEVYDTPRAARVLTGKKAHGRQSSRKQAKGAEA